MVRGPVLRFREAALNYLISADMVRWRAVRQLCGFEKGAGSFCNSARWR